MKTLTLKIAVLFLIMFTCACSNIKNNNSIFTKFAPTSKEYKNELAKKLKSNSQQFTYTFVEYIESNGKEYLDILIEGNDFKASTLILVNDWKKLEGIKKTKGLSYSGAELSGLKLSIVNNPAGISFLYKDLNKIID